MHISPRISRLMLSRCWIHYKIKNSPFFLFSQKPINSTKRDEAAEMTAALRLSWEMKSSPYIFFFARDSNLLRTLTGAVGSGSARDL